MYVEIVPNRNSPPGCAKAAVTHHRYWGQKE